DDGVSGVSSVAVLWNIQWVGHGVVLSLQSNLDDFHWCDNGNSLSSTGSQTSYNSLYVSLISSQYIYIYIYFPPPNGTLTNKDSLGSNLSSLGVDWSKSLVKLKRRETDSHLWNDT